VTELVDGAQIGLRGAHAGILSGEISRVTRIGRWVGAYWEGRQPKEADNGVHHPTSSTADRVSPLRARSQRNRRQSRVRYVPRGVAQAERLDADLLPTPPRGRPRRLSAPPGAAAERTGRDAVLPAR